MKKDEKNPVEQDNKTWREDFKIQLKELYSQYMDWLAFNKNESTLVNMLRLLYKIPVSIVVAIVSPILAIVLFTVFFATF